MAEKGKMLKGALAREPKMTRLSPGVYRGEKGQLMTQKGKALPRPQQPQYGNRGPAPVNNMGSLQQAAQGAMPNGSMPMYQNAVQPGMSFADAVEAARNQQAGGYAAQLAAQGFNMGGNRADIDPGYAVQPQQAILLQQGNMQRQPAIRIEQGNMEQFLGQSANNQGRYRLSPGVYGTREQAMQQMQRQYGAPTMGVPQPQRRRY
jgi:hypothetical protein